ncbi:MGDG synthase family glycosyltransferase [Paenibacillus sp. 1011MAR3C5]|uniref:MGDG synthase family glycosyltransferase n=1 Tax=Paenibacillus sp. 1011MAR3C5 TaxID=1675787 RepID=UPI0015FFE09B|nr:glycosyltransferase [Paenibacillus sp. 1011MAR3C5]
MLIHSHNRQLKLLIVYASYGEGHIQAAKALRDAYIDSGYHQVVLYDLMAESHPWLNEMTKRFYHKSYTHLPFLYGWMYGITKPMKHNSLLGNWLHSFGRHKVKQLLLAEKPDAVIYTFPFYAIQSMRKLASSIPSYAVITDFDLHRRWVHPSIERYYVATKDLYRELQQLGIRSSAIKVSGLPLKKEFRSIERSPELYSGYGLQYGCPTILIMAGAQGVMPNIDKICEQLLHDPHVQVAVVCGHNRQLKEMIQERFRSHPSAHRLTAFGYMDRIHELMALADGLITKPGGLTLAEAIAAELPAFLYRPVPGQEKQNALYLQSKGAAFISRDSHELVRQLLQLVNDPIKLMNCRIRIRSLQAKGSSHSAAETIIMDIVTKLHVQDKASFF